MTYRALLDHRPDNLDLSVLVDEGVSLSEAAAYMDARDAAESTGCLLACEANRRPDGHLVATFWWRAAPEHGRRLVNARTNLEG